MRRRCCTRQQELAASTGAPRSLRRLFFDGAFSNVSNPKIAVFYFAFLRARPVALAWMYRASGLVHVGLGVKLAFERRP